MYGVCTEDWHYPRDVAWCHRDYAFNAFLPDSGVRMRLCDNSFHVVSHVWSCIETLHRPLPQLAPRSIRRCDASNATDDSPRRLGPRGSHRLRLPRDPHHHSSGPLHPDAAAAAPAATGADTPADATCTAATASTSRGAIGAGPADPAGRHAPPGEPARRDRSRHGRANDGCGQKGSAAAPVHAPQGRSPSDGIPHRLCALMIRWRRARMPICWRRRRVRSSTTMPAATALSSTVYASPRSRYGSAMSSPSATPT